MSSYANVAANIVGEDRAAMEKVWDDDDKFDAWLAELNAKHAGGGKRKAMSNKQYLMKHAKHYGGEETR